jgi:tRNA A37 threonylcarbamoyladenosine biosynthesis protein TsaE
MIIYTRKRRKVKIMNLLRILLPVLVVVVEWSRFSRGSMPNRQLMINSSLNREGRLDLSKI